MGRVRADLQPRIPTAQAPIPSHSTETSDLTTTEVLIIGGGPIGLMGALLLSNFGVKSMVVDLRGRTSTHPRSRLLDTVTLESMREIGVEKAVIATGLGPDWTEYNRWFNALAKEEICRIYTPSFHTVPTEHSSSVPVMTAQDEVEAILFDKAKADDNVDLRFHTKATELAQDASGIRAKLTGVETGEVTEVEASFAIGADGVWSSTRAAMGTELRADFMDVYFQDVIFEADFSPYVEGHKGGLLFIAHKMGASVFQPLNGIRRWRCQIGGFDRAETMTPEFATKWISSAVGADEAIPIGIKTMTEWQFMPGRAGDFGKDRIFLAGDAAHVFIPTGGLGNNTGFVGIRNLAWKLAFVLKGLSPKSLLETYDAEHQPVAEHRVATGRRNAQLAAPIFATYHQGGDMDEVARNCKQYGNYDGVTLGYELTSPLCAKDDGEGPQVENPVCDFVPVVRSGRRAPNLWLDEAKTQSNLDWNGSGYTLMCGSEVATNAWQGCIEALNHRGVPIRLETLPRVGPESPYDNGELVLMRPDSIIADHWQAQNVTAGGEAERLTRYLPLGH